MTRQRYEQMLAHVEVDVPLWAHTRKHASRGDSEGPQFVHSSCENPQIERHVEVDVPFAMHTS
jgi:hypothetical protein